MRPVIMPSHLQDAGTVQRYILKTEDTLLLVVDLQEELCSSMEPAVCDSALENTRTLVQAARGLGMPVMVSERLPHQSGHTTSRLDEVLLDIPKIVKRTRSCWREGQIRAGIKDTGRNTVLVAGAQAHLCVLQTVMDLLQTGYNPVVVADAVFSRDASHRDLALQSMAHAGAVVYPAETVVCMLRDRAEFPLQDEALEQAPARMGS